MLHTIQCGPRHVTDALGKRLDKVETDVAGSGKIIDSAFYDDSLSA